MSTIATGVRVSYSTTSGFCSQTYYGTVERIQGHRGLVRFDEPRDGLHWVDVEYLIPTPTRGGQQ